MEIFVGNLASQVDSDALCQLFRQHGKVAGTRLVTDKFSGISRGFGFVEMPQREEALAAVAALDGCVWHGRRLTAKEALTQPRQQDRRVEKQ